MNYIMCLLSLLLWRSTTSYDLCCMPFSPTYIMYHVSEIFVIIPSHLCNKNKCKRVCIRFSEVALMEFRVGLHSISMKSFQKINTNSLHYFKNIMECYRSFLELKCSSCNDWIEMEIPQWQWVRLFTSIGIITYAYIDIIPSVWWGLSSYCYTGQYLV